MTRTMRASALLVATVAGLSGMSLNPGAQTDQVENPAVRLDAEFSVGGIVSGAPFSGRGTTVVRQIREDGTRSVQTTVTQMYRDGSGRERREQTVVGLAALGVPMNAEVVTIVDPVAKSSYTLEANTRQVRKMAILSDTAAPQMVPTYRVLTVIPERRTVEVAPSGLAGARTPSAGKGTDVVKADVSRSKQVVQVLGTKTIAGLSANGVLTTTAGPGGRADGKEPSEVIDEQWISTALKVVLLSRHHDPRGKDVEYQMSNIVLGEPRADLFIVPGDYTIASSATSSASAK